MSSVTDERLSKAYRLIEADELGAARAILEPLLAEQPNNADVWWLYAHAVTDPVAARGALDNVLRLDPTYPEATQLSRTLDNVLAAQQTAPVADRLSQDTAPTFVTEGEATAPTSAFDIPYDLPDVEETPRRRSSLVNVVIAAVIVVLIAALAGILLSTRNQPAAPAATIAPTTALEVGALPTSTQAVVVPATETQAVVVPATATQPIVVATTPEATAISTEPTGAILTEEATPTAESMTVDAQQAPTIAPTDVPSPTTLAVETAEATAPPAAREVPDVTLEAIEGEFVALTEALSAFTLPDGAIGAAQTDMGNTLLATVCSQAGAQLRVDLPQIMNAISKQVRSFPAGTDAVGARMFDCEANRVLLIIMTRATDAARYAAGNLTDSDFQALWQPH